MITRLIEHIYTYIVVHGPTFMLRLGLALLICLVLYIIIKLIVYKIESKIQSDNLVVDTYVLKTSALIGSMIFVTLMIFNILIGLKIIGLQVGLLMGGITFAIGYAMQMPIGNLMAGIILIMHKRIKLNVLIKIRGHINTLGYIEEINTRHVIVRTIQKQRILIPNIKFLSTPFQTFKEEPLTRGELDVKVRRYYHQEQVKDILMKTMQAQKGIVNKDMCAIHVHHFDGKGLTYRLIFFCNPLEKQGVWMVSCKLRKAIGDAFRMHGIRWVFENVDIEEERPDRFHTQKKTQEQKASHDINQKAAVI